MSLQIVQQPHRDILGLNGNTYTLMCSAVTTTGQPVIYQWQKPDDNGDFNSFTPTVDEVISPPNVLTITITDNTKSGNYQCSITDGATTVTTDYTSVTYTQKWYNGTTEQIIAPNAGDGGLTPVSIDTYIKGGLHVYEDISVMCNADKNYLRVKYGMLAIVKTQGVNQRVFRFNAYDPIALHAEGLTTWRIGTDWIEMPVLSVDDVDNKTIKIVNNQLSATGGGNPFDQDLNTFNSVNFHDVTTNVVIENTLPIQTYSYAASSTVSRQSLSAVNNSTSGTSPFNVLLSAAPPSGHRAKFIPLDLSRGNTFLLTVSDINTTTGWYDGFVLINQPPFTGTVETTLSANHTYNTFIAPEILKGKMYTVTIFIKHLNVMSIMPLGLYKANITTDSSAIPKASSITFDHLTTRWSAGSAPALYTSLTGPSYHLDSEDVIMFSTHDGGATWYGFVGGTDLR